MKFGQALAVGRPQFQNQPVLDTYLIQIESDAVRASVVRDLGWRSEQLDSGGREIARVDAVIGAQFEGEAQQILVKVHVAGNVERLKLDQFLAGCGSDAEANMTGKVGHLLAVFGIDFAAEAAVASILWLPEDAPHPFQAGTFSGGEQGYASLCGLQD